MSVPFYNSFDCCDFSNTSSNMLREGIKFLSEGFDKDFKATLCLILAGISLVIATGFRLYTKIRPKFPIIVNCWFCNTDSSAHFNSRNSWTCHNCDQYNGFTPAGDYNKHMPELSSENMNNTVQSVKWEVYSPNHNGLCRKCNINQELKVQQLASFVPFSKANFDQEIETYRQRLERAYRLCPVCENKLQSKLDSINGWISHLYPVKLTANLEGLPQQQQYMNCMSTALRVISIAGIIMSIMSSMVKSNQILKMFAIPEELKIISKWSLTLDVANFSVVLLSMYFTKPKMSSRDLTTSVLWFLTATVNFVSNHPVTLSFKNSVVVAHVTISLIVNAATALVHFRNLKNETRVIGKSTLTRPDANMQDTLITEEQPPVSNASKVGGSSTLEDGKRSTTPLKEAPRNSELPMKPVQSSLNLLSLGPPPSTSKLSSSVFEHKVFTPTSNLFINADCGSEIRRRKPIVHPPKFNPWTNHYWGSVPIPLSRSSSQSSGFASQNGTNYSSLPNSRSGSVCGDVDRFSVLSEPIYPSFKSYNQPFYVPCMPQFYLPPVPQTSYSPPLSPVSSQSTLDSTRNESVFSTSGVVTDRSVLSLMKEHFGLATVFLCSIVFNAVVVALVMANLLNTSVH